MGPGERWVGIDDVATHLGVGKDSIYRCVESCGLPARKVGRLLRFKLSQVDAWVEAGGGEGNGGNRRLSARRIPHAGSKCKDEPRTRPARAAG